MFKTKLIKILDIGCSIGVITCLNLVENHKEAWLAYFFCNLLFLPVGIYKKLPGFSVMTIILAITALRNYFF